jgi:hypothetical protein
MKQVWLSLFLAATFAIACSSSETTEKNTEVSTTSTDQTPSNTGEAKAMTVSNSMDEGATVAAPDMESSIPEAENTSGIQSETPEAEVSEEITKTESIQKGTTDIPKEPTSNAKEDEIVEPKVTTTTNSKPVATTSTTSKPVATPVKAAKPLKPALSHDIFDALLRKHVNSSGNVNYAAFKKDKAKLTEYLELLKSNPPQSSWSKNKEMAYWINLYNAFTIHSIVEKYPVSSVMDLEGGKVWDKKKIVIGGKSLSLNNIEKDKLLKRFKEPRVHFAVNCAAASCPPLLNKAWTEDNVQRYYAKLAKAFINNSSYNSVSAKSIQASQIFNWYAGDFGGSDKVLSYFQKYSDTEIKKNAKVSFKEYDWKLNKQ